MASRETKPSPSPFGRSLRIVGIFTVVGVVWTVAGWSVLQSEWLDPTRHRMGSLFLGLLTIFAAAALVLWLVDRELRKRIASEERYRGLFDHLPIGIYRTTPSGEFVDVNPAMKEMLRMPGDERLADRSAWGTFVHPEDREAWLGRLQKEGVVRSFEYQVRTFEGSSIWVQDNARAILNEKGGIEYIEGSVQDITIRREAEEELRHVSEALQGIIDAAPLAIMTLDTEGRVDATWNRAAEEIFGWSKAEVLGRVPPFIPAGKDGEFKDLLAQVLTGEEIRGIELRRQRRDGSPVEVQLFTAPLRDPWDNVRGVLAIVEDISGQKALEEQLRQSQKLEALGQITGGVAHDINNLLTIVRTNAELVADVLPEGHEARDAYLGDLQEAVDRGRDLIKRLLVFSRREELTLEPLDLGRVVEAYVTPIRRILPETITVEFTTDEKPSFILGDAGSIHQILLNLATNARDAMPDGGTLKLGVNRLHWGGDTTPGSDTLAAGTYACLEVTDTGKGIPEEYLRRVFEPFFTTKGPDEGTGLGMSMVYALVRQHGGSIQVDSKPDEGTFLRICFPLSDVQELEEDPEEIVPTEVVGGSETILVVEDQAAIRRAFERSLTRLGYTVLLAEDGEEGIQVYRERASEIDMVVTDVVMPRVGGQELLEMIRAEQDAPVPFLFVSGYAAREVTKRRGVDPSVPLLQKPWTISALAGRIREILDQANPD